MGRELIRQMKQSIHAANAPHATAEQTQLAQQATLALLERSVRMGHRRLAVVRLHAAVSANVPVSDEFWRYCANVAMTSKDASIQALYRMAARVIDQHCGSGE